jgi:hydrogenase maturation protease
MKYIIGIGTYAGGDDSIGLKIIEYMDKNYPRRDFKLIDMSDNGLNIFAYLNQDTSSILLVDCVKMGKQPGEHMELSPLLASKIPQYVNLILEETS